MNQSFYQKNLWWEKTKFKTGIPRIEYLNEVMNSLDQKLIHILTGLRRVGKSTLILQIIKNIIREKITTPNHILYFSVDEPSLESTPIKNIIDNFRAEFNINLREKIFVFIDEIQFRKGWEKEIKAIYDTENIKFILTGSSAVLLSENIAFLTGRYLKTEVSPLNFKEFLKFNNYRVRKSENYKLNKYLNEYLLEGGMPEYVLSKPNRYIQTTVESILYKDLVSKFELRNPAVLDDLILLLSDRAGSVSSSLKIAKILEINKDTVLSYQNYLKLVFLIDELDIYSTSRNKQLYNPPKIYFTDTSILNTYSSKINYGALAENVLYNYLRRFSKGRLRTKLGYWHEDKTELDFILDIDNTSYIFESKWVEGENEIDFSPLEKYLRKNKVKGIFYVTKSVEEKLEILGKEVTLIPLHKLLLTKVESLL